MIDWPNVSLSHQDASHTHTHRSKCVLGIIPVIYYSILLCVGVPVNILTAVALSRLACRTKKPLYSYLLSVTVSDTLSLIFIVLVGFLLQTAVFHREVPSVLLHAVSIGEFAANHAAIWSTVPLTVDRYMALCHPLLHRQISFPGRARRIILSVLVLSLLSGIPFFWWSDVWRSSQPPNTTDAILIWTHVTIIYFLPCGVFLVLNSLIVKTLRDRQADRQVDRQAERDGEPQTATKPRTKTKRLGKSTLMLLAITSVFCVLWAPRTVVVIFHLYVSSVHDDWRVHLAYDLSNMLAMLNTAVNFFLYCFVSKAFRKAVKDVVLLRGGGGGGGGGRGGRGVQSYYYHYHYNNHSQIQQQQSGNGNIMRQTQEQQREEMERRRMDNGQNASNASNVSNSSLYSGSDNKRSDKDSIQGDRKKT